LISYLAYHLHPKRILLAGLEQAVWADFPARHRKVEKITPLTYNTLSQSVGGSHAPDVTGGMSSKVEEMLLLVRELPEVTVQIFSGEQVGNLEKVLMGEVLGTQVKGD
jgi:isopentenyl phosphate kinase